MYHHNMYIFERSQLMFLAQAMLIFFQRERKNKRQNHVSNLRTKRYISLRYHLRDKIEMS